MSNGKAKARQAQNRPASAPPVPVQTAAPAPAPPSAGNLQTARALAGVEPDPLWPEVEARSAAEQRDLPKLGVPTEGGSKIEAGLDPSKLELGKHTLFHVAVTASGDKGKVDSTTDITFHRDPKQRFDYVSVGPTHGPVVGTVTTLEGQAPAAIGPSQPIPTYPVVLEYTRSLHLSDRDGRDCTVTVQSTVYFTYRTWETVTAGRKPSLDTLQALAGDFALTGVQITGYSRLLEYRTGALSEERTIAGAIADAEARLDANESLKDAVGLPKTFIGLGETAGGQFESLEAVLRRLDEKELERRAKLKVVALAGGGDPGDDVPPSVRGTLSTLEKAMLGVLAVFGAAALIAALPFEISFGLALTWIAASLLAASFLNSLINRIREAIDEGIRNPVSVLSSAMLDTIGIGGLYESLTNRSLLSGKELNRSEAERWESGTTGALTLVLTLFGVRSAAKSYKPAPDALPSEPPSPPVRQAVPEDHPGMDQWTEGHDPAPQLITRLRQARCTIGEQGVAFSGYPQSEGWGFIEGPSGGGGHAWNAPGFDGVAFRIAGRFEIEIIDNKAFASEGNVSSSSALTRNLQTNLGDLAAQLADPVYNDVPRIADVRSAISRAQAAVQSGAPLPPEVRLVVTNFGGRSRGITTALQALGITFRDVNQ